MMRFPSCGPVPCEPPGRGVCCEKCCGSAQRKETRAGWILAPLRPHRDSEPQTGCTEQIPQRTTLNRFSLFLFPTPLFRLVCPRAFSWNVLPLYSDLPRASRFSDA